MIAPWKIQYLIWMSEKYNKYIDYLRLNISQYDDENWICKLFERKNLLLDTDNSNMCIEYMHHFDVTFQKVNLPHWLGIIWSIAYNGKSMPVFIIQKYSKHNQKLLKSWWKIDYYGQYFRLMELWIIKDFFFADMVKKLEISRIDYKLDLFNYRPNQSTTWYVKYDYFITNKSSFVRQHWTFDLNGKNKNIHSWSIWNKENKTCVIRWYDKLKDSEAKGKTFLYQDYFDFETVFRIEFEYWIKFCKGFSFDRLDALVKKIENNIWLNYNAQKEKEYFTYEKLDFSDSLERVRFLKYFQWYAKTLIKNWINPYYYIDNQMTRQWFQEFEIYYYKNKPEQYITENWNDYTY